MEDRQDKEGWNRILEKYVIIFYEDGSPHSVGRKEGKLISTSEDSIILSTSLGQLLIPKEKVVRCEIK